ncbi:MAG: YbhB/YbcL family Raf kinase inhibitor-like protein [Candidatus Margulisiibacteriota bacterium]
MDIKIISPAFKNETMIPKKYTSDGEDNSPPLVWEAPPDGTKSQAIICDDPNAPAGDWVHWVIFNLPPDIKELPENIPSHKSLPNGVKQGVNDFRRIGYDGPCPPIGTHRYCFKIYALDTIIDPDIDTKDELLDAMQGHILAQGQIAAKYSR